MPVYSRKYLRQTLGRNHTRDTYVSAIAATANQSSSPFFVTDPNVADVAFSGQDLYARSWLLTAGNQGQIASFNAGSGTYLLTAAGFGAPFAAAIPSGSEYERHDMLPPADKDRAIDETVKRLWSRGEVAITTVEQARVYPLPPQVIDVLDCYYFANPAATVDRAQQRLTRFDTVLTQTGPELRIDPALQVSQQIVLDAILSLSLGTSDAATVNVPDERLILFGAEAQCWDLMVRKAPRGTADEYRRLRDEAARQFGLLSARFKVPIDRPLRLHDPGGNAF